MSVADPNPVHSDRRRRVALVLSNPSVSTTTGWPVGFWWSELSHPWLVFAEHGIDVELFSPDGGACVADAMSDPNDASGYAASDIVSQGFLHTPALRALPENTRPAREIELERIEDRLRQIGANYVQAGPWRSFAVRDGNLITGQQNFSGAQTARLIVQALGV